MAVDEQASRVEDAGPAPVLELEQFAREPVARLAALAVELGAEPFAAFGHAQDLFVAHGLRRRIDAEGARALSTQMRQWALAHPWVHP